MYIINVCNGFNGFNMNHRVVCGLYQSHEEAILDLTTHGFVVNKVLENYTDYRRGYGKNDWYMLATILDVSKLVKLETLEIA